MHVGEIVKFRTPENDAEAVARFVLIEDNGDRGFIRLLCDLPIPPVSLVRIEHVEPAGTCRIDRR